MIASTALPRAGASAGVATSGVASGSPRSGQTGAGGVWSRRAGGFPGIGQASVGHERLIGETLQKLDQVLFLRGGDREAPEQGALVAIVPAGAPAGGVVVDHRI